MVTKYLDSVRKYMYYDLGKIWVGALCYDIWNVQTFLNQENVLESFRIEVKIPALVEDGINLLVYAGEYDLVCNWLGKTDHNWHNISSFLNSKWVEQMNWSCHEEFGLSKTVPLLVDGKEAVEVKIPALVEDGINLLVYAGEYDLICNWLGKIDHNWHNISSFLNSKWIEQMNWSCHEEFGSSKTVPLLVDGKEAGLMRNLDHSRQCQ
ncbi:hypothetical protein YC2023_027340 [Brassica napus]